MAIAALPLPAAPCLASFARRRPATHRNCRAAAAVGPPSLYGSRQSNGVELLRILQLQEPQEARVAQCAALTLQVVALMKASPDLQQLRRTLLETQQQYSTPAAGVAKQTTRYSAPVARWVKPTAAPPPLPAAAPGTSPGGGAEAAVPQGHTASSGASSSPRANGSSSSGGSSSRWDWSSPGLCLAVYGLGSIGRYTQLLASGQQSERESTRASARLHQLALALLLQQEVCHPQATAPTASSSAAPAAAPTAPSAPLLSPRGDPSSGAQDLPPAALTGAVALEMGTASSSPCSAAAAAAPPPPRMAFIDPDFDEFDCLLIAALGGVASTNGTVLTAAAHHTAVAAAAATSSKAAAAAALASEGHIAGGGALASAAAAAAAAGRRRVLYYMPCCPRDLYEAVVVANLAAGTLPDIAVLGNSFRAQADAALLLQSLDRGAKQVPETFATLSRQGAVVEALAPDFAAHGVAVALHLFPPERVRQATLTK